MPQPSKPIPEGFHTVTPLLTCRNAERALEFYKNAFGAEIQGVNKDDQGRVMHSQIKIGDSIVMVTDEYPEYKGLSPLGLGGCATTLHIYTLDADAAFAKAVAAGAQVRMPISDAFWGDRYGQLVDPFGHIWSIATRKQQLTPEEVSAAAKKAFANMGKPKSAAG
ncbi:MAG: VOC family protein [Candidatus Acidiferrales bacterium]